MDCPPKSNVTMYIMWRVMQKVLPPDSCVLRSTWLAVPVLWHVVLSLLPLSFCTQGQDYGGPSGLSRLLSLFCGLVVFWHTPTHTHCRQRAALSQLIACGRLHTNTRKGTLRTSHLETLLSASFSITLWGSMGCAFAPTTYFILWVLAVSHVVKGTLQDCVSSVLPNLLRIHLPQLVWKSIRKV